MEESAVLAMPAMDIFHLWRKVCGVNDLRRNDIPDAAVGEEVRELQQSEEIWQVHRGDRCHRLHEQGLECGPVSLVRSWRGECEAGAIEMTAVGFPPLLTERVPYTVDFPVIL